MRRSALLATALATTRCLGLVQLVLPAQALAEHLPGPVPLRCQIRGGPWRACQMRVQRVGEQWTLEVGGEHYAFQHDGRGSVRMQTGHSPWVAVQARWTEEAALCWDGICARGELPLD